MFLASISVTCQICTFVCLEWGCDCLSRSRAYRRMKLMVVGGANKGKTSLLLNLVKRGRMKRFTEVERGVNDLPLATVGVELGDWEYSHGGKPKVTFMTWDFGGQVNTIILE